MQMLITHTDVNLQSNFDLKLVPSRFHPQFLCPCCDAVLVFRQALLFLRLNDALRCGEIFSIFDWYIRMDMCM